MGEQNRFSSCRYTDDGAGEITQDVQEFLTKLGGKIRIAKRSERKIWILCTYVRTYVYVYTMKETVWKKTYSFAAAAASFVQARERESHVSSFFLAVLLISHEIVIHCPFLNRKRREKRRKNQQVGQRGREKEMEKSTSPASNSLTGRQTVCSASFGHVFVA